MWILYVRPLVLGRGFRVPAARVCATDVRSAGPATPSSQEKPTNRATRASKGERIIVH